jgi:hypothetical protein
MQEFKEVSNCALFDRRVCSLSLSGEGGLNQLWLSRNYRPSHPLLQVAWDVSVLRAASPRAVLCRSSSTPTGLGSALSRRRGLGPVAFRLPLGVDGGLHANSVEHTRSVRRERKISLSFLRDLLFGSSTRGPAISCHSLPLDLDQCLDVRRSRLALSKRCGLAPVSALSNNSFPRSASTRLGPRFVEGSGVGKIRRRA